MQVLSSVVHSSPPPGHSMASSASIFDRRSSRRALELPRTFPNITVPIRSDAALTSITVKKPTDGRPSRKPTIAGFLPMPPISASPVCTPTTSSSSRDLSAYSDSGDDKPGLCRSTETSATSDHSSTRPFTAPTWISTPPTPPPKLFKRSVTCVTRRPTPPSITPSASFSASMEPHASDRTPKRCASAPVMSARARSNSESSISFGRGPKTQYTATDSILAASPLRVSFIPPRESSTIFFTRSKPFYNIAYQVSTDSADDIMDISEGMAELWTSVKPTLSMSMGKDEKWFKEKLKDNTKKFHALLELLSTEVSYLQDLKALVSIYLRNIPTLSLKRSSSSFSALSRHNSNTHIGSVSGLAHSNVFDIHGLQPLTAVTSKDREKSPSRHLFTNSEVEVLTRNAEQILQLHEHFVEELRSAMAPLGIPVHSQAVAERLEATEEHRGIRNIDAAITLVAAKFATEASRFTSYESFCAGHPQAFDIIRHVHNSHSTEWEAFEQRCASTVAESLDDSTSQDESVADDAGTSSTSGMTSDTGYAGDEEKRRRTNSNTSVDNQRTTRSRSNSFTATKDPASVTSRNRSRLTFMDFMIKPVQRICKYPLLLDQLKTGKALVALSESRLSARSDVDVVVESAAQAMRHVASAVDEARRRQDVTVKSALIVSRISFIPVPASSLNHSTSNSSPQVLTPSFVSSLGTCHMVGSLDIIHHRSSKPPASMANINVKYLGAFLYLGGYLILVKVCKGKTYEPRHWFRLCDFQITDPEMRDAWLPCSFRVSCKGHEFELAAACQREKEAWMTAIRESLAYSVSGWVNEPVSSLQVDGKGEMIPSALDGPFESIIPLPTIQSVSEIAKESDLEPPEAPNDSSVAEALTRGSSKLDTLTIPDLPSRRSSSTSVKAMFTPTSANPDTVIIRRSLPTARAQVEHGLHDVFSEVCLSARSQATGREEELFQAPHTARAGLSSVQASAIPRPVSRPSTSSGLSMAKSRLRKHESVRVPRRKSLVDVSAPALNMSSSTRTKSLRAKKRPKTLCIPSNTSDGSGSSMFFLPDSARTSSPPPFTRNSSSTATSDPSSALNSPTLEIPPPAKGSSEHPRSRPSSRMGSVRNLFLSRSSSPSQSSILYTPPPSHSEQRSSGKSSSGSIFMRWVKGSSPSHRRALSAPEVPNDQANSLSSEDSPVLPNLTFGESMGLAESPEPV